MTPNSLQSSLTTVCRCPIAAIARRSLAEVILYWPPPLRPRARADARPTLVRSETSSRSNSARAAKMPHQFAFRGCRVDRRSISGEYLEADASGCQGIHRVDQVAQIAAQTVEFPNQETISLPQRLEAWIPRETTVSVRPTAPVQGRLAVTDCRVRRSTRITLSTPPSQAEVVIDGDGDLLLGPQVALGHLDGRVPQQKLDMLEVPAILPAEPGAGPPQVIEGGQLLPESIGLASGRLEVSFRSVEQLAEAMYVLARILEAEGDAFAAAYEPETEPESQDAGDVRELFAELETMEASEARRGQEPRCL